VPATHVEIGWHVAPETLDEGVLSVTLTNPGVDFAGNTTALTHNKQDWL